MSKSIEMNTLGSEVMGIPEETMGTLEQKTMDVGTSNSTSAKLHTGTQLETSAKLVTRSTL